MLSKMKKIIFLSLAGLLLTLGLVYFSLFPRCEHKLSICAMFKDEAPFLREWIEYHKLIGTTHFYLYNNDSTDSYLDILEPYIQNGTVELIQWESSEEHTNYYRKEEGFIPYQLGAYNDCLKNRALGQSEWVAIIDIDEFIVPIEGSQSLLSLLSHSSHKKTGTFRLNWKVFGTSNLWELNPKIPMIEQLILKAPDDHPWNGHVKSIHRPEAVRFCLVHEVQKLHKKYRKQQLHPETFCIHHYWTRAEKQMVDKRGNSSELKAITDPFNTYEDQAILQYVPALKKALDNEKRLGER